MAPQPSPEVLASIYQARVRAIRQRVLTFADEVWVAQGNAFRDTDLDRLVEVIVPRVQAGQLSIAKLTSQYIAQMATVKSGSIITAAPVDEAAILGARGVPAAEVYRRPGYTIYTRLAERKAWNDAHQAGRARLASMIATDLQMSKVRQQQASMTADGRYQNYRRVLVGERNCALCTIASTQRYRVGSLMPIHPGCDCNVEQIDSATKLPLVLDLSLLETTHGHVAEFAGVADRGGRAPDYRELLLVRQHGEIGPLLTWRSDEYTSIADLAA